MPGADYLYPLAFLVGLTSTLHCVGMCGAIAGALAFGLPPEVRRRRSRLLLYVAAYNLGRIASYAAAGALAGVVGSTGSLLTGHGGGHLLLQLFATAVLVTTGLYLAGWLPGLAALERLGAPLWRRLEPPGRRLLPVRSPAHALLFGIVWGWLPCGVVYSALLTATGTASAAGGALFMLAFGLGTLPGVFAMGIFSNWLMRLAQRPGLRRAAGITIIAGALAGLAGSRLPG